MKRFTSAVCVVAIVAACQTPGAQGPGTDPTPEHAGTEPSAEAADHAGDSDDSKDPTNTHGLKLSKAREAIAKLTQSLTRGDVERALDRMAVEISGRLSGKDPLVLCVLNGALIPMGHLLTRLSFPLRQDYIHVSRYGGDITATEVEWIGQPSTLLKDETVLVFDDILDEGVTLAEIVKACKEAKAKAIYTAVLVEKQHNRGNGFKADFVGLPVEDSYVFGFGMDYKGYLRNSAGIYAVAESV